jgi:hypothetical protein
MSNKSKKIVLILALNALFLSLMSAQVKFNKELPSVYDFQKDTIFKVYKGDVVLISTDSAYLFNQKRFGDMERLMAYRDFMRNKDPMAKAFSTVWENHGKSLDSLEKYINLLKINADKTAETGQKLAENTLIIAKSADVKLEGVNSKLTIAQNKLDTANVRLEDAVKLIKADMRWRWLKDAAWFIVGGLIGYFVHK